MSRGRQVLTGRMLARRAAPTVGVLACTLSLAGCGLFGSGITITAPSVMRVSSGAFTRTVMPPRYTCTARHAPAPPLEWSGAPKRTKSIALVVDDAETPYVYWIVFDIKPGATAIMQGQLPPGARQARGSAGYDRYDPPCPGSDEHSYRFTVYALNTVLHLPNGTSLESAWRAIAAATIGRGRDTVSATSQQHGVALFVLMLKMSDFRHLRMNFRDS